HRTRAAREVRCCAGVRSGTPPLGETRHGHHVTPLRPAESGEAVVPVAPRVKVCGITTPHDALLAQSAGADAIGMIFAPRSQRFVTQEQAAAIVAVVGPLLTRV